LDWAKKSQDSELFPIGVQTQGGCDHHAASRLMPDPCHRNESSVPAHPAMALAQSGHIAVYAFPLETQPAWDCLIKRPFVDTTLIQVTKAVKSLKIYFILPSHVL
jgi:hypothetical protein